jgi:hypothetical protein
LGRACSPKKYIREATFHLARPDQQSTVVEGRHHWVSIILTEHPHGLPAAALLFQQRGDWLALTSNQHVLAHLQCIKAGEQRLGVHHHPLGHGHWVSCLSSQHEAAKQILMAEAGSPVTSRSGEIERKTMMEKKCE